MATSSLVDVRVPSLGESVTEAVIANWSKADGSAVGNADVVAELETDKATVELPAPAGGVLKVLKKKGDTVNVGDVIAQIDTAAGASAGKDAPKTPAKPEKAPAREEPAKAAAKGAPLSPAVQRLVSEKGVDPEQIPGTGKDGRLTKGDVIEFVEKQSDRRPGGTLPEDARAVAGTKGGPQGAQTGVSTAGTTTVYTPPPATPAETAPARPASAEPDEHRVEMSRLRQTIARRLVDAQQTTASLTTFNEVDMTAVMELRSKYKESFEKKHGIGLGFMSFFAKAVVHAAKAVPTVNAMIDGNTIVYRKHVHLGVAVSTERGLMVPVVRDADQLSMAQIESEIKRLATKARDGKITLEDLAGGTFTVTNGGVFGSLLSTPILNPPQSAILGMHKIEKRPVVVEGPKGDEIAIRPMMYLALTYDHRIIDGRESVTFLVKVKEALEDPSRMLMEI